MTDAELIKGLRENALWVTTHDAADRIEALVKELAVSSKIGRAFEEDAGQQRARAERLEAALENLTIAIGMGWDLDGVLDVAGAALKGDDREY